ncbi:unnamed protein product [Hyaloperonospora brassicae]|uniref:AP2/ERF domain-containing protein n=1 Tax=Hyaloperonospora brassicae TaxID=162125 RepID=A0AAV0U278_HYABA|nr:unnamed protein product [Hyaloperonospora brassicae]
MDAPRNALPRSQSACGRVGRRSGDRHWRGGDSSDDYHVSGAFVPFGPPAAHPASDSVHQTGAGYSSNNAGDGPEKTRDRKSWFPRFKSNWLGTFRSRQMFYCCECAVLPAPSKSPLSSQAGRYKGAEGKHCRCGKDQWHLAKSVEETEYNRRMEISKAFGGMRYDEAVLRLRSMGQSELDFKSSRHVLHGRSPTQARSTHDFASTSSLPSALSSASCPNVPKRARSVSSGPFPTQYVKHEPSSLPNPPVHVYGYDNPAKHYSVYNPVYGNNASDAEYAQAAQSRHPDAYEHLTPAAPYGDEEGFGELLEGILEDDQRGATTGAQHLSLSPTRGGGQVYAGTRSSYYTGPLTTASSIAPLKRTMSMPSYATSPSTGVSPHRDGAEHEYSAEATRRSSLSLGANQAPPSYMTYHPGLHQQSPQPSSQPFSYHHDLHQHQQPPPQQPQQQPHLHQQQQQQHHVPELQQQHYHAFGRPLSMTPNAVSATSTAFSA